MTPPTWRTIDPITKRYVTARSPRAEHIWKSDLESDNQMLADLQTGSLRTHVMVGENAVRAIPPELWSEEYVGLSVGGTLLDLSQSLVIPRDIKRGQIVVLEGIAYQWLLVQNINAKNPEYPRNLGKSSPSAAVGRRVGACRQQKT